VAQWLENVLMLENVPLPQLVPDQRMLPPESIRFGYLDTNWLQAAEDGALSVGIATTLDRTVQDPLTLALEQKVAPALPSGPIGVFLLRSALVAGWPGLQVTATIAGVPLPFLRLDTIGPGIMLGIVSGMPDTITFTEPHEGLVFGVDDGGQIVTRTLNGTAIADGPSLTVFDPLHPQAPSVAIRADGLQVLNIVATGTTPPPQPPSVPVDLLGAIGQALNVPPSGIASAFLALQLLQGPELVSFTTGTTGTPGGAA